MDTVLGVFGGYFRLLSPHLPGSQRVAVRGHVRGWDPQGVCLYSTALHTARMCVVCPHTLSPFSMYLFCLCFQLVRGAVGWTGLGQVYLDMGY